MLHEEQMEEKCKKDQEEIRKRMEEVERQKAEEREADIYGEEAREGTSCEGSRARCYQEGEISPTHTVKHNHKIPAFYIP
ncbi:hypothetical protein C2845_PM05G18620 [Panicum miliaceum]|uniref:Uncharacterized protein n=1 Tax=Panicum miliaceum TaxID=4540 RepID=A0A3L6T6D9_PANMI|nr:hypothetical protein C2845_PM05G18620 [Panicum miliaceum]